MPPTTTAAADMESLSNYQKELVEMIMTGSALSQREAIQLLDKHQWDEIDAIIEHCETEHREQQAIGNTDRAAHRQSDQSSNNVDAIATAPAPNGLTRLVQVLKHLGTSARALYNTLKFLGNASWATLRFAHKHIWAGLGLLVATASISGEIGAMARKLMALVGSVFAYLFWCLPLPVQHALTAMAYVALNLGMDNLRMMKERVCDMCARRGRCEWVSE